MNVELMKQRLLELAIQGKLVPQLDEEPEVEQIGEAPKEVPFEIPRKWKWVKFSSVVYIENGDRGSNYPAKSKLSHTNTGLPFVSAANLDNKRISQENLLYLTSIQNHSLRSGHIQAGDYLYCIRGSLGKYGIAEISGGAIASSLVIIRAISELIDNRYLNVLLDSSFFLSQVESKKNGTAQPNLGAKQLASFVIPLPPLPEQRRIVARLQKLLPLIETYEKNQAELTRLTELFKASLLEQAIQGKLVPQLDEEPEVEQIGEAPKEVPFEIPKKWKWCTFEAASTIVRGGSPRPIQNYLTHSSDGLNWIKIGDSIRGNKYITSCKEKICPEGFRKTRYVKSGSLILSNSMSFGYPYILKINGCIHDGWLAFSDFEKNNIDVEYLYYILLSRYCKQDLSEKAAGAVVKNLNINKVKTLPIPLPPLLEQRRIVSRLEELQVLVNSLTASAP